MGCVTGIAIGAVLKRQVSCVLVCAHIDKDSLCLKSNKGCQCSSRSKEAPFYFNEDSPHTHISAIKQQWLGDS